MAQFGISKTWGSVFALVSLITFVGLLAYAALTRTPVGGILYLLALIPIVAGFAAREDVVAVGGVVGLNVLVILDVYMHIGFLYSIWGY